MSCCGGGPSRGAAGIRPNIRATRAVFRYEGDRPVIVIGRVTGARYHFTGRGAEVAIDIRDRASVRQLPRLREMRVV